MKRLYAIAVAAFFPLSAPAQDALVTLDGPSVALADLVWVKRPVVVFADSPNDPNFRRQIDLLARDPAALEARDVVVITDTDPEARSEVRQELRPRGFSLVVMDKDGRPIQRKPLPWAVREIVNAIDRSPIRRQEIQEGAVDRS